MAGPSTQSVTDAKRTPPAPPEVVVLDSTLINDLGRQLVDEFLPNVDRIPVEVENLESFLEYYARDKYVTIDTAATFRKKVSIPNTPITIHPGGVIRAWATLEDEQVSMPRPPIFEGFTAWPIEIGGWTLFHGLVGIERLFVEDGQVYAGLCCIPFLEPNVTKEILNNPIGQMLFPNQQKVSPVPFDRLLKFLKNPSTGGTRSEINKMVLDALHEVGVKIKVYRNKREAELAPKAALASLSLFINVPDMLQTIETGAYRRFDFTGILEDSQIDLQELPLYLLPRPENIYFSADSTARFAWSYEPDSKKTDFSFKDIGAIDSDKIDSHAKVFLKNWFISHPMELSGSLRTTIEAGGRTHLYFEKLAVRFPMFPAETTGKNFVSMEGILNGHVFLHMDEAGKLQLDSLALQLEQFKIKTPEGQSIGLGSAANAIFGDLGGELAVSYDTRNADSLIINWDTKGDANLARGLNLYEFVDVDFSGQLLGQLIDRRLWPQLNGSSLLLQAKAIRDTDDSFVVRGPRLEVIGGEKTQEKTQKGERIVRTGILKAGGQSLEIAGFSLKPSAHIDLTHTSETMSGKTTRDELTGTGSASLEADEIPVVLKSRVHGRADDDGFAWGLDFDETQTLGPVFANGRLRVGHEGRWKENQSIENLSKFIITTYQAYNFSHKGDTLANQVRISGQGNNRLIRIVVDAGSLPGETHGRFVLAKRAESDRITGNYLIEREQVPLPANIRLEEIQARGNFVSAPLKQLGKQPAIHISQGDIRAHVNGDYQGPIAIEHHGPLSYDPETEKIYYTFSQRKNSTVSIGPIPEALNAELKAALQGTIGVKFTDGKPTITGRRLGMHSGQVFIDLNRPGLAAPPQRSPFLDKFFLSADIFSTDLKYVHLGGDGLSISTDIYSDPLGIKMGKGARKRRVAVLGIERLPLSNPQYWPVLRQVAAEIKAANAGGSQ